MRTLIQNYSSNLSTEPFYFTQAIKSVGGEAEIWVDENISAYDIFDSYQPEVFICHFSKITPDIMKYLSQHPHMSVVVNITGATQSMVDNISETFIQNKITCPFLFTNTPSGVIPILGRTIKVVNLLPALDIFQRKEESVLFSIGTAIVSSQPLENIKPVTEGLDTYHLLSTSDAPGYDLPVNIPALVSVYDKYEEFVLVDALPVVVSQLFFETSFRAKAIRVELNDQDRPKFEKFLGTLFSEQKSDSIGGVIKEQILKKHNAFTRTARLVRNLKNKQLEQALDNTGANLG